MIPHIAVVCGHVLNFTSILKRKCKYCIIVFFLFELARIFSWTEKFCLADYHRVDVGDVSEAV